VTSPGLPVNIDTTYADDGADASVKAHQIYHDTVHALANEFATAASSPRLAREIWARNDANTLFEPVTGESKHIPTVTFDVTGGGAYTFQLADAGTMKGSLTSDAAAVVWTVPLNATVAFPIGTAIKVLQRGIGQITIAGATGVTLNAAGAATKTAAQNAAVVITKLFADVWLVEGGVV
jgi:hypothetical protein